MLGDTDGFTVGALEGLRVGSCEGFWVGELVGKPLGDLVGEILGDKVGISDGLTLGEPDGEAVGDLDGDIEGESVNARHLVDERLFIIVLNGEYLLTTTAVSAPPVIGTVIVNVSSNTGSGGSRATNALRKPEVSRSASRVTTSNERPTPPSSVELTMSVRMAAVYLCLSMLSLSAWTSPP